MARQTLPEEAIHNLFEVNIKLEVIIYYHEASGLPTKNTWLKSIKEGYYMPWSFLTAKTAHKHFTLSEETQKRHMQRTPLGLRINKIKLVDPEDN